MPLAANGVPTMGYPPRPARHDILSKSSALRPVHSFFHCRLVIVVPSANFSARKAHIALTKVSAAGLPPI
jgi:hypothetical protein